MSAPTTAISYVQVPCVLRAQEVKAVGRQPISSRRPLSDQQVWQVDTERELRKALSKANDGDMIAVQDGLYDIGSVDSQSRITLVGTGPQGAVLTKSSLISLYGSGSLVQGLVFQTGGATQARGASRDASLILYGDRIQVMGNTFRDIGVNSTISDGSGYAIHVKQGLNVEISNNTFTRMHGIAIISTEVAQHLTIANNDFLDSPSFGGAGEIAHIGVALSTGQAQTPEPDEAFALIRDNHVCGWTLESELISIKSAGNTIENNFIERSGNSAIVVRMGNDNLIRGNTIFDSLGFPFRISGERNRIEDNTVVGRGALAFMHSEIAFSPTYKAPYNGQLERAYWAANDNMFIGNRFFGYTVPLRGDTEETIVARLGKNGADKPVLSTPSGNRFTDTEVSTRDPVAFKAALSAVSDTTALFERTKVLQLVLTKLPPRPGTGP